MSIASKLLYHPGEQILAFTPEGAVLIWGDRDAEDTPAALARYAHPFYRASQSLTATGYNRENLGGL